MANTLTDLIPDMYNALDVVSRELVGFIPAVSRDSTFDRAAKGQVVRSPVAPAATVTDVTPAQDNPDDGDQTIGNVSMTIDNVKRSPIVWNGDEQMGLDNNGAQFNVILRDQFVQSMRALTNLIEADLGARHAYASRAYGTAGTTPFATAGDFTDASYLAKVLLDNGAPNVGNNLVLDTTSGANLVGKQSRVDIAGQDSMLRQGVLLDTAGFAIRQSAAVVTSTKGTGTSYTTSTDGFSEGDTSIAIITGSGTVVTGDVVTFAGDTEKYIVKTGVAAAGTIVLAEPGLRQDIAASAVAMTIHADATRSMGFAPSAIALATRIPALPKQGDKAIDRMVIQDPHSGLAFEVSMYPGYREMQYELSIAWGVKMVKPEHCAVLLG